MQFAHDASLLHLDIKPDNIMVGSYGEVYLVDWGLSKQLEDSGVPGQVQGTPSYMAPEQASGEKTLTPAADIFALGVVLYELTVGVRPFRADSVGGLLTKIRAGDFLRGEDWSASPEGLRDLLGSTLAKDPSDRPASAAEVAIGVQEFLDGRKEKLRRQEAAARFVEAAGAEWSEYERLIERATQLEAEVAEIQIPAWSNAAAKKPLWAAEDALVACRHDAEETLEKALDHLLQAQKEQPDDLRVREALSRIYWSRFEVAEESDDGFQKLYLENQLRQLRLPDTERLLAGEGA